MLRLCATTLLLSSVPLPLFAHNASQGHSVFVIHENRVEADIHLIAADYHVLVGMDGDEDGVLTDDEVRAGEAAFATFAAQTVRVAALDDDGNTTACKGRMTGIDRGAAAGVPPLYPFHMSFECPSPPKRLRLRMGLFIGSPVRHHNIARIEVGGRVEQALFSPERREVDVEAAPPSAGRVAAQFLVLGIEHILFGFDHLLFLLVLLVVATRFRAVVLVVTAFTVAHSVTLAMAALGLASLPPSVVEPAIAASIVYVAVENGWLLVRGREPALPRATLAFLFGLVHGFGFAGALMETGLPRSGLLLALATFNAGVECGQLAFCAVAYVALRRLRRTSFSRQALLGLSGVGAMLGAFWLVGRLTGG